MEKQTAVEWLAEEIIKKYPIITQFLPNYNFDKEIIEQAKQIEAEQNKVTEDTSDGFHTFKELYEFRMYYNAALFNEWGYQDKYGVHKSLRHHDGELCFGGEWFIVCAVLPDGQQISNHYHIEHWQLFKITEAAKAVFSYDGHTSKDVIDRLHKFITENPQNDE